jgi:hypothetical protein
VLATQERTGTTVERLAAFATWVDSGLALGPLVGGFVVAPWGCRSATTRSPWRSRSR